MIFNTQFLSRVLVALFLLLGGILLITDQATALPTATRWVTTTADSGAGSLREALQNAVDGDVINFSSAVFPPASPATIYLTSELPPLDGSNIVVDASEAGVILNGSGMSESWHDCLIIQNAANITVRGLQFINCRDSAIDVRSNVNTLTIGGSRATGSGPVGQGNRFAGNGRALWADADNLANFVIQGNLIGVNLAGTAAEANRTSGITVKRVTGLFIGGFGLGERNLISGNTFYGLEVAGSSSVTIENNFIGVNLAGTGAIGNLESGVFVTDTVYVTFKNNLVSGNLKNGAYFGNIDHMVAQGNIIGTDVSGSAAISNGENGLVMMGTDLAVGGSGSGEGNLVSGNMGWAGLEVRNEGATPTNAVIQGNMVGTNSSGSAAIPNANVGIYVGGANLTFGGVDPGESNLVSGNGGTGLLVEKRNTIGYTVEMVGNTFGTNLAGDAIISNQGYGSNIIGITQATVTGNLFSGTGSVGWAGIHIQGNGAPDAQATLQGNLVGVNRNGISALPNEKLGIYAQDLNLTIGGYAAGEGNIISGNQLSGMEIQNKTPYTFTATIAGNRIGVDKNGMAQLGNSKNGIYINGMGSVLIDKNLISSNGENGISVDGGVATSVMICDNRIGTDVTGALDFGNGGNGIWLVQADLTVGNGGDCLPNLISGNAGTGIVARGDSTHWTVIQGNKIGTDISGQSAIGQSSDGIWNQGQSLIFGGPDPADRNLVSGNLHTGLVVTGSIQATIQNNFFGTNLDGDGAIPNGWNGIVLNRTQNAQISQNLISGNTYNGIALETGSVNNTVYANKLGTDISGLTGIANLDRGLLLNGGASYNQISDNLISGNRYGVVLHDLGTAYNVFHGNLIGVDITGLKALPNTDTGLIIDNGAFNQIGGDVPAERNIISGNLGSGIILSHAGASHNIISGNYIGVAAAGSTPLGNQGVGLAIFDGGSYNRIGGDTDAERNLISANQQQGVNIGGAGNLIINNYIGTDLSGTLDLGNALEGLILHIPNEGAQGQNQVSRNLVSGNGSNGIVVYSDQNVLQGNIVGLDVLGMHILGNQYHGIYLSGTGNLIGGDILAQRNLISGNGNNGITLGIDRSYPGGPITQKATENIIQGNFIGANISGTQAMPNGWAGVYISGVGNLVGGASTGDGNVISGNSHEGVILGEASETTANWVQGNWVGADVSGVNPLPNGDTGIAIWGGVGSNTIGGDTPAAGNIVAYNHDLGIAKWKDETNGEGVGNLIAHNQVHHNEGVGLRITINTNLANNNVYANGENRIEVPAGTIQGANQTWAVQGGADTYFIHYDCLTCELVVASGARLTLDRGVKVYLDYNRTFRVQGTLIAQGIASAPVRITGPRDSIWAGDWKGIVFAPGSQGTLNHAEITFAQVGLDISGVVNLANSTVSGHRIGGIKVGGSGALTMSNNTIGGNFKDTYNAANNAFDIRNDTANWVNAQGSWWGQISGPVAARIIGKVDTANWRQTEGLTDLWQSAELLGEGTHYFVVASSSDLDWFRIPIIEGNRTLKIEVQDLPLDYDVFLFGQLGSMVRQTEDIARRIRHISRMMHTEENQAIEQLDDIARIMHIGQLSSDNAGLDTGLDTGQLLRASTNPGTRRETLEFEVGNQPGWYYILVAGNNGAHSPKSYRIIITTSAQDAVSRENYYVPVFPPITDVSENNTLILLNSSRLVNRYGQTAVNSLLSKTQALAAAPGVNGKIIDISNCNELYPGWNDCNQLIEEVYADWDAHRESVYYANRVAATIKSLVTAIRTSYPALKYLVFLGNDQMLPHWRAMDESPMANEHTYALSMPAGGPVYAALSQGYFLTDDYFSSFEPITWHGRELYLPQYAVGRLVETPTHMETMIDAYLAAPQSDINSALITGYDFLKDQATAIQDQLTATDTQALINDSWTTQQLTTTWFTASPADFVSLNAHFTHWQATPGSLDLSKPLLPAHIQTGLMNASGNLVYSVGCHSGLSLPDSQPIQTNELDFTQVFAAKGITYIGNTGYGYGDKASLGYSEVISLLFIKQLKTGLGVGDALLQAKNLYFQQTGVYSFSPYDEKALEETILYGLPMQGFVFPTLQHALDQMAQKVVENPCTVVPDSTLASITAQRVSCSITSTLTTSIYGDYFSISDQTEINIGQPIQPRLGVDITLPGMTAHGVFFEGGVYQSYAGFDPVITSVITESTTTQPQEPIFAHSVWTPSTWDVINSIRTPDGISQQLVIIPAQYRAQDQNTGIERVFDSVEYTVYYSDSLDSLPPFIWEVELQNELYSPNGVVTVTVFDRSGVMRVSAAYTGQDGVWNSVELTSTDGVVWSASLPSDGVFFIQALDRAGNVAVADAKGQYYSFLRFPVFLPMILRP